MCSSDLFPSHDNDANKIKGVDTKAQEATIDNLIAQTSNEKVKKGLILGQIRIADAEEELKRYWPIGQKTKPMKHAGISKACKRESIN